MLTQAHYEQGDASRIPLADIHVWNERKASEDGERGDTPGKLWILGRLGTSQDPR